MSELINGTILNNQYEIESYISEDKFWQRYRVKDINTKKIFILKELFVAIDEMTIRDDNNVLFLDENIFNIFKEKIEDDILDFPSIYNSFEENDTIYIVREDIEGELLSPHITFSKEEAKEFLIDLNNILKPFHQNNIIHGDISYKNIVKSENGYKLINFINLKKYPDQEIQNIIQSSVTANISSDIYSIIKILLALLDTQIEQNFRDKLERMLSKIDEDRSLDEIIEELDKKEFNIDKLLTDIELLRASTKKILQERVD